MKTQKIILKFIFILLCMQVNAQTNYPNTFLWQISGNNLQQPSYLFGTLHLKNKKIFEIYDSVYYALEKSDGMATELTPDDLSDMSLDKTFSVADEFDKNLSDDKKREYKLIFEKAFEDELKNKTLKELIAIRQSKKAKNKAEEMPTIIDLYLYNIAKQQGKIMAALEVPNDQRKLLQTLGSGYQELYLKFLKNNKVSEKSLADMYIKQDLNGIANIYLDSVISVNSELNLNGRNIKMAFRMDSLAQIRSTFFAVGCGHLPGDSGLIKLLINKGYTVTPVMGSKKIAPENYKYTIKNTNWITSTDEDSSYLIQMPGKPKIVDLKAILPMNSYMDLTTNAFYGISTLPKDNGSFEDKISDIENNYKAKDYKIISKTELNFKTYKAVDLVIYLSKTGYYKLRFLNAINKYYLLMLGTQKQKDLTNNDANKFFESLEINSNKQTIKSNWQLVQDTNLAYSCMFPTALKNKEFTATNNITHNGLDKVGGNVYLIVINKLEPTNFIANDSVNTASYTQNIIDGLQLKDVKTNYFEINKMPALTIEGNTKENSKTIIVKYLYILRGTYSFSFVSFKERNNLLHDSLSNVFFNSIKMLPYPKQNFTTIADTTLGITASLPQKFIRIPTDDTSTDNLTTSEEAKNYISTDTITNTTFYYTKTPFSKYKCIVNDSTFFDAIDSSITTEDEKIISKELLKNNNYIGAKYKIQLANCKLTKFLYINVTNKAMHEIYAYYTPEIMEIPELQKPFQTFEVKTNEPFNLYKSTLPLILSNIQSTDSNTLYQARYALNNVAISKADLNSLQEALLKTYATDSNYYTSINQIITNRLSELNDASTVTFIEQNYPKPQNEKLRVNMLQILANAKSVTAINTLKKCLLQKQTLPSHIVSVDNSLTDSLVLCKSFFPDLGELCNDTNVGPTLVYIADQLIDSNYLNISEMLPFENKIKELLNTQLQKQKQNPVAYIANITDVINMLGKFNSAKSNECIAQCLNTSNNNLKQFAVKNLLSNKQAINPSIIIELASDETYFINFYTKLKSTNTQSVIPTQYLNQQYFSKAYLMQYFNEEGYGIYSKKFIKQVDWLDKQNNKVRYYIYTVQFNKGEDNYPVVVGPFSNKDENVEVVNENYYDSIYFSDTEKYENANINSYIISLENASN